MKKISLYLLLAVMGMLTTACNEDFKDWNDPQAYGPEEAVTIPGFAASSAEVIDLNQHEDADTLKLFSLSEAQLPEGYTLGNARIEMVPAEGEATASTLNTDLEGKYVNAASMQNIVKGAYGLRPVERLFKGLVLVNAIKDGQAVLINAGTIDVTVIPQAPEIEEAYYITGAINGWNNTDATYELTNGGADPYENPVFSITLTAEQVGEGFEFKLTPKSGLGGDWSKCLTASDEEGKFADKNAGGNFKVETVEGAKFYKIDFDMLAMTYKITALNFADYIYEIGDNTGWGSTIPMANDGKGVYYCYAYLTGEFKFRPNLGDWAGDWGQDPAGAAGTLVQEGENNCSAPEYNNFYRLEVDLANMTWKVDKAQFGLIGSATPAGWDADTDMTYNVAEGCWEITVDLVPGEFKFRANDSWDWNYGGTADALWENGANIPVAEAGNYTIKLFAVCNGKSTFTITKN